MNDLSTLPPSVLAALGAFVLVQLGLQIAALVSLIRTPATRLTLGGRKWAWALIILLGEIIGPIVYFAAGRLPAPATEQVATIAAADRANVAADTLYGAQEVDPAPTGPARASITDAPAEMGADGTGMGELP